MRTQHQPTDPSPDPSGFFHILLLLICVLMIGLGGFGAILILSHLFHSLFP